VDGEGIGKRRWNGGKERGKEERGEGGKIRVREREIVSLWVKSAIYTPLRVKDL